MRYIVLFMPLAAFLLLWHWAVADSQQAQFLFASPLAVWQVALAELPTIMLWHHIGITFFEAVSGLLIGTLLGTALGLLLWSNQKLNWLIKPYIVVLGSLPVFALAPMLIIWFGTGLLSKVIMAGFAVVFVAMIQAYEGATVAAARFSEMPRALGVKRLRFIRFVIVPAAWQWVLTGFKLNIGLALVGAFIGEFVSAEAGLGHYILKAGALYDVPRVIFGLVLLSLMALLLTAIGGRLRRGSP